MSEIISLGRRGRPPTIRHDEAGTLTVPVMGIDWTFRVKDGRISPTALTTKQRKFEGNGEADFLYAKALIQRSLA